MARTLSTRSFGPTSTRAHARAFWITRPGCGEIRSEPLRAPAAGDVLVRTLYTAISRGTETLVWSGRVPPSEHARMRAPFQEGDFPAPVKYGYINVGVVEQGPAELRDRIVFCHYPHQTRYVVPAESVFPLPDTVPPQRGVLAASLETALNGVWDAGVTAGGQVTVIGAGAVGSLAAWIARWRFAAEVELIDTNPARAATAESLGVDFASPAQARRGAQTILHASGSPAGLRAALDLAGFEATITELSWYGDTEVTLPLGAAFHSQRLTLRSSQVGAVAASERRAKTRHQRMEECLALLGAPALDVLITGESPFDELPQLFPTLAAGAATTICHRIRYDSA